MTLLELPPSAQLNRRHVAPAAPHPRAADDLPAPSMQGSLQRFQLQRLINGILAQDDLIPGMRASLLHHLAVNPERPELALLAHLRDIQDPNDLPPG
ncbi:hypothetical protein ACFRAU_24975 [Arthrobacter sp. NPDC056691]|uniref:hypothetical protein n=1 Tax=Arthrobacter sp. NPDC056691 TaxID=3345913 RepID=UPI00366A7052